MPLKQSRPAPPSPPQSPAALQQALPKIPRGMPPLPGEGKTRHIPPFPLHLVKSIRPLARPSHPPLRMPSRRPSLPAPSAALVPQLTASSRAARARRPAFAVIALAVLLVAAAAALRFAGVL